MRYPEPGIRVVTVFFAALVGFGLKHLADETARSAGDSYPDDFSCFVLAVLLFLRFLLGSANHLWHEHCFPAAKASKRKLGFDLLFLIVYGLIAVYICYAETLAQFFWRSVGLLIAAVIWSGLEELFNQHERRWAWWLLINGLQILAIVCVASWAPDMGDLWFGYARWKVILLPVYFACLAADFQVQMKVLETEAP